MSLPLAEIPALPLHTAGKYVAAAYIVAFVIVLIYVAIMAIRLGRIERELGELLELTEEDQLPKAASGRPEGAGMSELLMLGVSHKTAPVALRERLAFDEQEAVEFLGRTTATEHVREGVVISTCNRTEVYLVVTDPVQAESEVLGALARRADIRPTELAGAIYSPRNCDAARQLFRVTCGLESMIVGEAEVQGQVRRAHEVAMRSGATGPLSNRLFAAALLTGKRVRTETAIGTNRVSVPSVAVELAQSVLGDLTERHVVIIGAGETSELTARALADQGAGTIFVANRHADRALSLAQRFGGSVVGLEQLPEQLVEADIVVASTASPHPIVEREELELVMGERGGRPLLLIDIAVPRDIDHALPRTRGGHAVRHRRPPGGGGPEPQLARGGDAGGARDRRGGDPPLRALDGPARRAADGGRPARTRRRHRRAGAGREHRALGGGLAPRHRPRGSDGQGDRRTAACTSRRSACARLGGESSHASLEVLRELFALSDGPDSQTPPRTESNLAEVHDLRRHRER